MECYRGVSTPTTSHVSARSRGRRAWRVRRREDRVYAVADDDVVESPGPRSRIAAIRPFAPSIAAPSAATIRSPASIPASAAGVPSSTRRRSRPARRRHVRRGDTEIALGPDLAALAPEPAITGNASAALIAKPTLVAAVGRRPGNRGVDADDLAGGVDERAARVAGRDRSVGLDQAVEEAAVGADRAVERRDDAERHRGIAVEIEGEPDGDDLVTEHVSGRRNWRLEARRRSCARVPGRCRRRRRAGSAARFGLAGEPDADRRRTLDDMGVRQDFAIGGDDDARADGVPSVDVGTDRHDRWRHHVGHGPHRQPSTARTRWPATGGRWLRWPSAGRAVVVVDRPAPTRTPAEPRPTSAAASQPLATTGQTRGRRAPRRARRGRARTPGAGGGSTGMRTVYRLAGAVHAVARRSALLVRTSQPAR